MTKVFGIGLHKTGTTTLDECFRVLGYRVCPQKFSYAVRDLTATKEHLPCLCIADRFEAFADSPWNYSWMFRVLDNVFPKAKFVLTVRQEDAWFGSLLRWVDRHSSGDWIDMLATLGTEFNQQNRATLIDGYRRHNEGVQNYFASREGKLLVIDWQQDSEWSRLCEFLGKPVPEMTFPHMLKYDAIKDAYVDSPAVPVVPTD